GNGNTNRDGSSDRNAIADAEPVTDGPAADADPVADGHAGTVTLALANSASCDGNAGRPAAHRWHHG
ncbi:MAG: hypothetical protein IIA23_11870, partial [Chloroflexi bacterium]|nr:hypothetical protein [Chloroflexota bacterium]